jgi:hypothetical protein
MLPITCSGRSKSHPFAWFQSVTDCGLAVTASVNDPPRRRVAMSDTDRENSRNPSTYGSDYGVLTGHQSAQLRAPREPSSMPDSGVRPMCRKGAKANHKYLRCRHRKPDDMATSRG